MAKFQFRLVPREERFFELFSRAAENSQATAQAFHELFADYKDVNRAVRRIKDLEHEGDRLTHDIFEALNRSFIAPFDRDDIARLAGALDDVVDWIDESAMRIHVYAIAEPTDLARQFARILLEQTHCIVRATLCLDNLKSQAAIRKEIIEIHRLENEADDLMEQALGILYRDIADVRALVLAEQWKDIYTVLEEATDKAEQVGIALESILMKHT